MAELSPLIDRVRCGGGLAVKWNRHLDNKVLEPVHIKGTRLNHHFTKNRGEGGGDQMGRWVGGQVGVGVNEQTNYQFTLS